MVYRVCMSRTNIDLDDEACRVVMQRYRLSSKREAVNFALRTVAGEPLGLDEARRLRGSGWDGDLVELRTTRGQLILIDTSAWIEFLRDAASSVCARVDALLEGDIATCHPVRMEVLAGARDERHLHDLRGLLARATLLPTEPTDYEQASAIYRACRQQGETVRKMIDCLIAAIAIREGVPILHADADFEAIARHTPLRIDAP